MREAGSKKKGGSKCNRKFDHKVGWRRREAGRREEGRGQAGERRTERKQMGNREAERNRRRHIALTKRMVL